LVWATATFFIFFFLHTLLKKSYRSRRAASSEEIPFFLAILRTSISSQAISSFSFFAIFLISHISGGECFSEYECGEWSGCNEEGIQQRACVDVNCERGDIIERKFCLKPGCKPDIQCSDWEACNYNRKINDIVRGELIFEGYTERFCRDLNGCIEGHVEIMPCDLSIPIVLFVVRIWPAHLQTSPNISR